MATAAAAAAAAASIAHANTHAHSNAMDAEAQFLESRKARTDNASQSLHTERRRRTDDLQEFWTAFKAFRASWTLQLARIQLLTEEECEGECEASTETDTSESVAVENADVAVAVVVDSEGDKRRVRLELCGLQDELELRRKQCFSQAHTTNTVSAIQIQTSVSSSNFPTFKLPAHELPLPDLRQLHAEFTQCRADLDRKRNTLLPKGKFVFQRYREAIRLQQEEETSLNIMMTRADKATINSSSPIKVPVVPIPVSESSAASMAATATTHQHDSIKHTLENIMDCEVQVYTDGRAHISSKNKQEENKDSDRIIIQLEALDSSPLVLSNIQNSNVVM